MDALPLTLRAGAPEGEEGKKGKGRIHWEEELLRGKKDRPDSRCCLTQLCSEGRSTERRLLLERIIVVGIKKLSSIDRCWLAV